MKQADVMKILDLLKAIENKHDTLKLRHDMLLQLVTALQSRVTTLENRIFPNPIASPAYPPGFPGQVPYPVNPPYVGSPLPPLTGIQYQPYTYIQLTPGVSVSPSIDANTYFYNCIMPVSSTKGP